MKSTKILLFVALLGIVFSAGKCKKKDKGTTTPGIKGNWKIVSITNSAGATPANLANMVNGIASFGDTNYEFKNNSGGSAETGTYVYDANAKTLTVTPAGTSVFTNANAQYTFEAELASPNLTLRVNIAPAGKPANIITVSLQKQE
ncbi:MAG: lipocalin family protein [Raineya sp.]|nr:lipocalin family protein [Raineya sp.]MDW8295393.1 lipocalin family protein [Raineya sp.]